MSPLVSGHGGMMWPSTWQDGQHQDLEMIDSVVMGSDEAVRDPVSGDKIKSNTDFLTDAVFIEGHGMEYAGMGEATNPEVGKKGYSARNTTPWSAPGKAPSLGGGCGLFRGPVMSCKEYDCSKKPRPVFHQGASFLTQLQLSGLLAVRRRLRGLPRGDTVGDIRTGSANYQRKERQD